MLTVSSNQTIAATIRERQTCTRPWNNKSELDRLLRMLITRIQYTIGSKVDVDRRKMDVLALVLCGRSSFDGIDLTFVDVM